MTSQSASSTPCDVGNLEEITPVIIPISQSAYGTLDVGDFLRENAQVQMCLSGDMEMLRMRIKNLEIVVDDLCRMFLELKYQDLSVDEKYGDLV